MSRHRNVGGWVADTYDDDDDDEGAADGMEEIPVNSYVMARFYGDDSFCPGTVIGWSQYGYLVSFEGYEDEIAQDTDPRDVELVRLPDENEACDGIDMDTFNDLVAEIASVMEGEAGESDIRAALETSGFSKLSQMARQRQVSLALDSAHSHASRDASRFCSQYGWCQNIVRHALPPVLQASTLHQ